MKKVIKNTLAIFIVIWSVHGYGADTGLFPRPPEIEPDVKFWTRVFTEANTKQGFIHDDRFLGVVYEKVDLPIGLSRKARQKYVEKRKKHYKYILRTLAKGKRKGLSKEEKRVLNLWPENVSKKTLHNATKRLRFQLGQADKYLAGLKRSGAWKNHILKTLDDMGLPHEIASLPHVESSFNPKAYSKVGAAGMWQFTRSTGRRFMRIDHIVDERMDPFKATIAAARLLENNYAVTGTWPLALTAYNHGAAGMRNAARKMGTTDIVPILRKYRSRTFKFASRNFYVAFLAAVDVEKNAEKYFGNVKINPPMVDDIVKLPAYLSVKDLKKAFGISLSELKRKNPALRQAVWKGHKYVPRGYELRLEKGSVKNPQQALANIAASKQYAKQKPDTYHKVRRGQTLSTIARRYGVSVNEIMALNNIRSRNRIWVGQTLRLPQKGQPVTVAVKTSSTTKSKPTPAPEDGTYVVRRGDSINRIAKKYGVSQKQILALNELKRANRIYPGQILRITPPPQEESAKSDSMVASAETNKQIPQVALADTVSDSPSDKPIILEAINKSSVQTKKTELSATPVENPIAKAKQQGSKPARLKEKDLKQTEAELRAATAATDPSDSNLPNLPPLVEDVPPLPALVVAKAQTAEEFAQEAAEQVSEEAITEKQLVAIEPPTIATEVEEENQADLDLAADPSDYSVSPNNTIEVQAAETLGHYAEWLNLRASRLRKINKMRYGKPVVIGKRIKLDFSQVNHQQFETARKQYHKALQEEFFDQYEIVGSEKYVLKRGDSLWRLAKRRYQIPMWLLRQYNPDLSINNVRRGAVVTFPRIEERSDKEASNEVSDEVIAVKSN